MNYFPNRLTKPTTAPSLRKEVEEQWQPVTRYTRAGSTGKLIKCPHCGTVKRTYHFSWYAVSCSNCKAMVNKSDWSFKA